MGLYSDVVVLVDKGLEELVKKNADQEVLELLMEADSIRFNDEAVRYDWRSTQWNEDDHSTIQNRLHHLLEKLNKDGDKYHIWKITSEYMYDGYSPLDTWGGYRHTELNPSIIAEIKLTEPVLKDKMLESEMEQYLLANGFDIQDEVIDSTKVVEEAIKLGYDSYLLEGNGDLCSTLIFIRKN